MQVGVDSCQYTSLGTYLLVPSFFVEVDVLAIKLIEEIRVANV